jgi:acyl-CoA thioesterase-1
MRFAFLALCACLSLPALGAPKVLIIGDSISIGYTPFVTKMLAGKAEIVHNDGNAAHTNTGVEKLDSWLGSETWSVITFNFGLHDLKIMEDGKHQVGLRQYEQNLDRIAARLKATRARLIYITTTPVPEGKLSPLRRPGDERAFNDAARRVMTKHGVPVVDLEAFARARLAAIQRPSNVHFTDAGSEALATLVASAIQERLP